MLEPKRPLKVFLCHAHVDRDSVQNLYSRLTRNGVNAWLDKSNLFAGQDWELEIRKAVREADVIIVCLSKRFNLDGFRQKEVRLALDVAMEKTEDAIFIIPVRLEECDTLESLRRLHWVDLFEDDGYHRLLSALQVRAEKVGATLPKDINEVLTEIFDELLKGIPKVLKDVIKKQLAILKDLFKNRPPRIMIIGRRGAGKSSLVNAIFGEKVAETGAVLAQTPKVEWYQYQTQCGEMQILDTRGLSDSQDDRDSQDALSEIYSAIDYACPDVILFVGKAKEVDAGILQDLEKVAKIHSYISEKYNYQTPIIGLVSQVDELDPAIIMPPYNDDEKQKNITDAVNQIEIQMRTAKIDSLKVFPISTLAYYDKLDNKIVTYNRYWNVDLLINYLIETLPKEAQVELARLTRLTYFQKTFSRQIITTTAFACGTIAVIPIPVADFLPITGTQVSMIIGIAYIGGKKLSLQTAKDFLVALGANIGAAFVLKEVASALSKIVFPGVGGVVSASVAATGTWAIGEAAIAYFIDEKSIEEAKAIFKNVKTYRENTNS